MKSKFARGIDAYLVLCEELDFKGATGKSIAVPDKEVRMQDPDTRR
jgi:hypothetical protein